MKLHQLSVNLGKRNVLRGVSLSLSGGLVFLTGLNGSGKTTLLRAISGEIPYQGQISLDGQPLEAMGARERARHLAMVHQRPNMPFQLKAFDFVLMGRFPYLGLLGNYTREDRDIAMREMERMGVADFAERRLDEVSGGELQKVLIARALTQDAPWLLLDEPAQQLDPKNRVMLYGLLRELEAGGKRILCTPHDREALEGGQVQGDRLEGGGGGAGRGGRSGLGAVDAGGV